MTTTPAISSTNVLTVLAKAAQTAAQLSTQVEVDVVNARIQQNLTAKIAAIQSAQDTVELQSEQTQLAQLQQQLTSMNTVSGQIAANGNLLTDIVNQLAAMQTSAANGDSIGFDSALGEANSDLGLLRPITPNALFQPDGVQALAGDGLGINSSASYDLSTPSGQAAAEADVGNAQQLVQQISAIVTSNQLVATTSASALNTAIGGLSQTIQQTQSANQSDLQAKTTQLMQQAQDQEHLIQLALGNSTQLSTALSQMATTPSVASSPFDVLDTSTTSVPALSSTSNKIPQSGSTPALLSLLA